MSKLEAVVSVDWLVAHRSEPGLKVIDVRWRLGQPAVGRTLFEKSRIPGAAFLDIDKDLSEIGDPKRGRHPLPHPARLVETLAQAGIGLGSRVIAYDDAGGMHAARLFWLMRWLGAQAAVLDGGFPHWIAVGQPIEEGAPQAIARAEQPLSPQVDWNMVVSKEVVRKLVKEGMGESVVLDARARERYRGGVEPIDPKKGHVPGAKNAPATENLKDGRFRSREELRAQFEGLGVKTGEQVIAYCGSGVTAAHDVLALELAGFSGARLYAGSWSEWSHDPEVEVAVGEA